MSIVTRFEMQPENTTKTRAFLSKRTILPDGVLPATLIVRDGKIHEIIRGDGESEAQYMLKNYPGIAVEDFGSSILMPGIVDSHVHVNEPGRTEWEGFRTATRAAAAGGVTTIADMPLNSIPPTTAVEHLKTKAGEARGKIYVDVAFWGGVIPGNEKDLRSLVDAGVVGFKCFLCPSGVDEFPHVSEKDVKAALAELKSTESLLAFHAECGDKCPPIVPKGDPALYETFLQSRPGDMEKSAIEMVCQWCKASNVRCHIVHLSNADALSLISDAKTAGAPLTVETCYHYLVLSAEEVPEGATEFKCCPPVRSKANQDKLWNGLMDGMIDMIVSDHSPSIKELKTCGNFLTAWGGISSLQFGLPLLWTAARRKGLEFTQIAKLLCERPARLCGLSNRKGGLLVGMDADFAIWNPDESFKVEEDHILFKNKLTPYLGKTLFGKVIATVLGGEYVYKNEQLCDKPAGNLLLKKDFLD